MNQYVAALNDYLKECEKRGGFSGVASILDFLWECYSEGNPVDDGLIRQRNDAIDPILRELSLPNSDRLFDLIDDLIRAYQRAAFLEGLLIGARLSTELCPQ